MPKPERRPIVDAAIALVVPLVLAVSAPAQAPSTNPVFEVASVKANKVGGAKGPGTRTPVGSGGVLAPQGDRLRAQNATLRTLVRYAYGRQNPAGDAVISLEDARVSGGPPWMNTDAFDIEAKLPPRSTPAERALMMRALLAERFLLRVHDEQRTAPVYTLVRTNNTKLGEQLRPRTEKCVERTDRTQELIRCGVRMRPGHFIGADVSMQAVAMYLSQLVDRVVVDRTDLVGKFDFEVKFTPSPGADRSSADQRVPDPFAPSIFSALREQLGLKLEPTRAPIDVLVVDEARRPRDN